MLMQRLEEASQIDRSEIEKFASCHDDWCVSLYLPTHEQGKEVRQDPIRLKNRLADAEALLSEEGVEGGDIEAMFGPLRELCDFDSEENQEFWSHQGRGLGILISQDSCRLFRLRVRTPEETIVGHRFNVRPLLRASQRDGEYGLIAVSRGAARFFEGSGDGLDETKIDDLPESLQAIVGGDHQKGFGLHSFNTAGSGKSGGEEAVPHGHVDKDEFEVLKRYFNEIVEALIDADNGNGRPIAFAGVTELFPYFKDAAEDTHLHIVDEPIAGNPDESSADELHENGWPLIKERLKAQTAERLEKYRSQEHTELAGSDLEEVVVAAHDGRVELLLIKAGQHPLGSYDPTQRRVVLSAAERSQEIDLFDLAAAKTLASSGEVRIIPDDQFDLSDSGVAAVYRFPMPDQG